MPVISADTAWDDATAFAAFCGRYRISRRRAADVFRRLRDPSAFCEALQALNPSSDRRLSLRFISLIEAQMIILDPQQYPEFGSSSAVKKVSKKELRKSVDQVKKWSFRLRSDLLAFLRIADPAVEFHAGINDSERNQLRNLVQEIRSAVEPLNRLSLAVDRTRPLLSRGTERAVLIPATPFEIFDRSLARLWHESGKSVTTSGNGPFAVFLENSYSSFGHTC